VSLVVDLVEEGEGRHTRLVPVKKGWVDDGVDQ
jgi:hypothetical protein